MKTLLSYIIYNIADFISPFLNCDSINEYVFPPYRYLMMTSFKLDENNKIWKL